LLFHFVIRSLFVIFHILLVFVCSFSFDFFAEIFFSFDFFVARNLVILLLFRIFLSQCYFFIQNRISKIRCNLIDTVYCYLCNFLLSRKLFLVSIFMSKLHCLKAFYTSIKILEIFLSIILKKLLQY